MNKYVFLFELRRELSYMTPDDKESAARYYEEYFADAGPENEQSVIEELGPPARLAAELRREYEEGRPEPTGRELSIEGPDEDADTAPPRFADSGVRSPLGNDPFAERPDEAEPEAERGETPPEQPREGEYGPRRPYGARPPHAPPYGSYRYGRSPYGSRPAGAPHGAGAKSAPPPRPESGGGGNPKKKLSAWMIVLIVFGAITLGPPAFVLLISLFVVVLSLCVALLAVGVGVLATGIGLIVSGVWALNYIPDALLMFGLGLVTISFGLPLFWVFIRSSARMMRATVSGTKKIWRKIRGIGGGSGE